MKNFGTILALCAFQPSAAFLAPTAITPSLSFSTGLGSTTASNTYFSTTKTEAPKVNGDVSAPSKAAPSSDDSYTVRATKILLLNARLPTLHVSQKSFLIF